MAFLTAEWRKLIMANYAIDAEILNNYLPYGTELDLWRDQCFVSIVGFMFVNTKLMGIGVPFHKNFEEVNLRFYVKRKEGNAWKRGVVFIKEIVPKPALALVANLIYNENYETLKMHHNWEQDDFKQTVEYKWKKAGAWNSMRVTAKVDPEEILPSSFAEFISEQYWGYAKVHDTQSNEYEVTHPKWRVYSIINADLGIDFKSTYGKEFSFLSNVTPESIILAEGSKITVENKRKIKGK